MIVAMMAEVLNALRYGHAGLEPTDVDLFVVKSPSHLAKILRAA